MKKRILVADDDPGIRDIFQIILERAGYETELKPDGYDIMNNNYVMPDLFLIDKQMCGVDGLEICVHLKGQAATRGIPVIMISATPDIKVTSKTAGADDYIEKPFDLNYLLEVIEKYISRSSPQVQVISTRELR